MSDQEIHEAEVIQRKNDELVSYSPQGLISQALAQNQSIETLERLMALQERWEANQAKTAFLKAMSGFQSECPEIIKTKKVNYPSKSGGNNVKYDYAPLGKITKIIQPLLLKYELSYRWEFEENDKIKCACIVSHSAGHSITNTMTATKDTTGNKNDIQSIGSTRTYLQRYTLSAALGLSTIDEDNDGQTTQGQKETIPAPQAIDKIVDLISKVHTKTNETSLTKLDSLIGNEESLAKRKEYIDLLNKQLRKVGSTYLITTIAK